MLAMLCLSDGHSDCFKIFFIVFLYFPKLSTVSIYFSYQKTGGISNNKSIQFKL